jgi:hypothetical protein
MRSRQVDGLANDIAHPARPDDADAWLSGVARGYPALVFLPVRAVRISNTPVHVW